MRCVTADVQNSLTETSELNNVWSGPLPITSSKSEEVATPAATIEVAETATASAGLLPDNPFYVFKDIGRGIQSVLTFDDAKKAELKNKFANEKIAEAGALIGKGKFDKAADHLKSYGEDVAEVGDLANKVAKTDKTKAEGIITQALSDQIRNQAVVDSIGAQASDSKKGEVKEVKTKTGQVIGGMVVALNDSSKIEEIVSQVGIENIPTNTITTIQNTLDTTSSQPASPSGDLGESVQVVPNKTEGPDLIVDSITVSGDRKATV
ncbi:MAG: hypothetical protein HYT11_04130, partial [Candidatus Levybacteria bacterium]|nr:hypothetical protein [Candidatus Levybacteria bacterium]